jgi:hypothetical protein
MVVTLLLLAVFLVGGCAGILLAALMRMSGDQPKQPESISELDLDVIPTQW